MLLPNINVKETSSVFPTKNWHTLVCLCISKLPCAKYAFYLLTLAVKVYCYIYYLQVSVIFNNYDAVLIIFVFILNITSFY